MLRLRRVNVTVKHSYSIDDAACTTMLTDVKSSLEQQLENEQKTYEQQLGTLREKYLVDTQLLKVTTIICSVLYVTCVFVCM